MWQNSLPGRDAGMQHVEPKAFPGRRQREDQHTATSFLCLAFTMLGIKNIRGGISHLFSKD